MNCDRRDQKAALVVDRAADDQVKADDREPVPQVDRAEASPIEFWHLTKTKTARFRKKKLRNSCRGVSSEWTPTKTVSSARRKLTSCLPASVAVADVRVQAAGRVVKADDRRDLKAARADGQRDLKAARADDRRDLKRKTAVPTVLVVQLATMPESDSD